MDLLEQMQMTNGGESGRVISSRKSLVGDLAGEGVYMAAEQV